MKKIDKLNSDTSTPNKITKSELDKVQNAFMSIIPVALGVAVGMINYEQVKKSLEKDK